MKSFFTKLVLKFANTDLILKFAQSKLVSYIESLMTSKNVSVKLIGEKAAKTAKICSHVATLCQNAAEICEDDKVDAAELAKAVKDIKTFVEGIKTTLN